MRNFAQFMKQAQKMQEQVTKAQESVTQIQATGESGAGLVSITVNGKGVMKHIAIDASLLKPDEGEILEDLILAAYNDAFAKAEEAANKEMEKAGAGLNLPDGMHLPF
ncbi:MAG: YbaB/EbfC family nucleoid-associated protein [Alphaproteobacteria bacterium]|nr:MAG: YbaB/EbfC family nucleoid-associated protein [Alphaproteobacteria bacterium]